MVAPHGRDADDGAETLQGDADIEADEPQRSLGPSGRVDSLLAAIASAPGMPIAVAPGDRLADNFQIERRLGIGGMGIVYLAHHLVLDRKVAIKLHRTDSVKAAELLLREARAIASVEHEHVVVVHEVGTWQNYVFVAMEYVDGWTAREWVARQQRSWREVVALYVKAGRGLQAAHERGLTHRDFKPDNVLVGRDGRVRVADFGLARAALPEDELATISTDANPVATEGVVGSPGYMAPEQFRSGAVDARADQFGFCVSLFEALSGKRPFAGTTVVEIVNSLRDGAAPLPSEHAPAHVRAALRRGLQIDPDARFSDMATLLAELGRDPVRARRRALQWTGAIGGAATVTWLLTRAADPLVECRKTVALDAWWDASTERRVEAAFAAVDVPSASDSFAGVRRLLEGRREEARAVLDDACVATHTTGTMSKAQLDDLTGCLLQSGREQEALVDLLVAQTTEVIDRSVAVAEALPTVARCTAPLGFRTDDVAEADRERADALLRKIARVGELFRAGLYAQAVAEGEAMRDEVAAFGYPAIEARLALDIGGAHQRLHHPDLARTPTTHALRLALAADDVRLATEASIALIFSDGYLDNQVEAGDAWATLAEGLLERLGTPEDLHLRFLHARALALRVADRYPESLAMAENHLARIEASGTGGVRLATALSALGEGYRLAGRPA